MNSAEFKIHDCGPFNRADALAFLRKHAKGRHLRVRAGVRVVKDDGTTFEELSFVPVTRRAAEKYIRDVLSDQVQGWGYRLKMSLSDCTVYVGA